MSEFLNQYLLEEPFQNKDAGFSRWTYARRKGKDYFLKEFMNPVYPADGSLSAALMQDRIADCREYEDKKRRLYEAINAYSDGNAVRISEFFRSGSHYYISMNRVRSAEALPDDRTDPDLRMRLTYCTALAHSLMSLHEAHIVHADLKETNILPQKTVTGSYVGKIIDYDGSFFENEPPHPDDMGGDQVYMAPETCLYMLEEPADVTCKVDVFAAGILFHKYLTGEIPGFDTEEYAYLHEAVLDGREPELSPALPDPLRRMIRAMLSEDPGARPSMQEVFRELRAYMFHRFGIGTPPSGEEDVTMPAGAADWIDPDIAKMKKEKAVEEKPRDPAGFFKRAGDL